MELVQKVHSAVLRDCFWYSMEEPKKSAEPGHPNTCTPTPNLQKGKAESKLGSPLFHEKAQKQLEGEKSPSSKPVSVFSYFGARRIGETAKFCQGPSVGSRICHRHPVRPGSLYVMTCGLLAPIEAMEFSATALGEK